MASEYYRSELVNYAEQTWEDEVVTIRIYRTGWSRSYSFKVRRFNQPDEEILEDEEVME